MWDVPQLARLPSATRGVCTQWSAQNGGLPQLLAVVGHNPQWLIALLHMRAVAHGTAARELVTRFEVGFAQVTGHSTVQWPSGWGGVRSRQTPLSLKRERPELEALDPTQQLLLGAALEDHNVPCSHVLGVALRTAFATCAYRTSSLHNNRVRLAGHALSPQMRKRWESGLGLEPPMMFAAGVHAGAIELVETAASGEIVDPTRLHGVHPHDAIALIGLALTTQIATQSATASKTQSGFEQGLAA